MDLPIIKLLYLIVIPPIFGCEEVAKWFNVTFPQNYNDLLPDFSQGAPVNVSIVIELDQISDINDHEGIVEMLMEISVTWQDDRIVNKSDECYQEIRPSDAQKMWKPAFYVLNSKTMNRKATHMLTDTVSQMVVTDGRIHRVWDLTLKLLCDFKFTNYPFDQQDCRFGMANKNLDDKLVLLEYYGSFQNGFKYNETQQRKLPYTIAIQQISENEKFVIWDGLHHSVIGFEIVLNRKFTPYMLNIYLPSTALTIISMFSFLIPPDVVPGRMALLITIYLVLANTGNSARENSPTSGETTLIDIWLQICQAFVALALFEYALLLHKIRRQKYASVLENGNGQDITLLTTNKLIKRIDDISIILFPLVFVLFAIIYATIIISY